MSLRNEEAENLVSANLLYPRAMIDGNLQYYNTEIKAVYRFLYVLRRTMVHLAANPIEDEKEMAVGEVTQQIIQLPRRHALVRVGDMVTEITTLDTPASLAGDELQARRNGIIERTREKYCRPAKEVEKEIAVRLGLFDDMEEDNSRRILTTEEEHGVSQEKEESTTQDDTGSGRVGKRRFAEIEEDQA